MGRDALGYESTLGFVGYQFGKALLIELGYYEADSFYCNGETTNTWAGTWTGKNGVNSLDEFKTAAAQDTAIVEAFGYDLKITDNRLSNAVKSLGDLLGTTVTYASGDVDIPVTITMTGLLAAAHLPGAWGTLNRLLSDTVSFHENGTSIL